MNQVLDFVVKVFILFKIIFVTFRREKWLSRELNPNLKSGSVDSGAEAKKPAQVGDGGASWLRRAFKRAEEQAQRSVYLLS